MQLTEESLKVAFWFTLCRPRRSCSLVAVILTTGTKHPSMESPPEAAAADPTARSFSQVVFIDIPHSYPPSANVTCSYTLTSAFQPNPRDWVGIFKVGWSSAKDYQTFVWVEPCLDVVEQQAMTKQAVFKEYYLPKDDIEFYQFCYIDNTGQVRGASTPFCFKNPVEQSLESSPDDDLLVITTQEQVEQSVREKAELMKELDQIRKENETLKSALKREQQEVQNVKDQNEQKEQQMKKTVTEMDEVREENKLLKSTLEEQLKETDRLKEKYDRAVMKINQLKEEREELRRTNDTQSVEIDGLKSKLREKERELLKMKDNIQLLQVDLQSSNKEKVRLSSEMQRLQSLTQNMQEVQQENQTLRRSLSQQEALQKYPDDDLKVKYQALLCQLDKAQEQLTNEKEESRKFRRLKEAIEQDLVKAMEQLQDMALTHEDTNRRFSKQELLLTEAHAAIAEKDSALKDQENVITLLRHEREELTNENGTLRNDIERLSSVYAESHHRQPEPVHEAAGATASDHEQRQNAPEESAQSENLYENMGNIAGPEEEEPCLVCRHCQESFPGITRSELDQHEQSHRVCPFCTMICDNMEQSVFEDHVYSHEL
uniref:SKICH domain-containing protein n=1 Tax=Sphaeramia orbicularis TaxID=375764 RepID=A0A672YCB4_9TELE